MYPVVEQLSRLGILPHSNANGIGLWPEEQLSLVWLASQSPVDGDWAEIGTFCGGSACLLSFLRNKKVTIHSVDPNPRPIAAVNFKVANATNVIQHRLYSEQYFLREHNSPLSFCFIDGFHSFSQVLRDFLAIKRFLVPGAIVAFHDVSPNLDLERAGEFARENFDNLLESQNEDFYLDEAVAYILGEFTDFELVTLPEPFRANCRHFQETGLNRWIRGKTSPFNAIAAIRRK